MLWSLAVSKVHASREAERTAPSPLVEVHPHEPVTKSDNLLKGPFVHFCLGAERAGEYRARTPENFHPCCTWGIVEKEIVWMVLKYDDLDVNLTVRITSLASHRCTSSLLAAVMCVPVRRRCSRSI